MKARIKNAFNKIAIRNKASCVAIVEQIHSTFLAESVGDKSAPDAGSKTTVSGWTMEKENDERKQCREYIDAEIQVRTIAMDFWASLDHKLQYKYPDKIPNKVRQDIYNCSLDIRTLDNRMSEINDILNNKEPSDN